MKKICILGITGSIGSQAVDVINNLEGYSVVSASCNTNFEKLDKYICDLNLKSVWVKEKSYLEDKYPNTKFYYDVDEFIKNTDVDAVINALVGVAGLSASIATIKAKKELLLANKESLVLAGDIINNLLKEYNVRMLPIDSEHSAIFQCLDGKDKNEVSQLIITASGGALRDLDRNALKGVKVSDVLNHPTWKMGGKITVDCATMVNKGFEVIEAHHLFGFDYDQIKTVLHEESAVHGAIKFKDGSVICQMGATSMMLPIQYALTYPARLKCNLNKDFDLCDTFNLHFRKMDYNRYPMLELAYKVAKMGGIMPAVYCAANDIAVNKFLKGEIEFLEIENIINKYVNYYSDKNILKPTLDDIYKVIDEISK